MNTEPRRFPPPWSIDEATESFCIRDALTAQVTGTVPPSGVLITPPPAPVAVPPSGVLVTVERRAATTLQLKTAQTLQTTKRATPVKMRRHVVHWRSAARRETITRTTTADQSIVGIGAAALKVRNGV